MLLLLFFLSISIIVLRYDFRSVSPFSGVFGILLLAVMGELGTGVARFSWFPCVLSFPFLLPFYCQSCVTGSLLYHSWLTAGLLVFQTCVPGSLLSPCWLTAVPGDVWSDCELLTPYCPTGNSQMQGY